MLRVMVQAIKLAVVLVLAAIIVLAAQRTLVARLEASTVPAGQPVPFEVQPEESIDSIAARLHEAGLVRSPTYFKLRVRLSNADTRIRAGRFVLYTGMSVNQIIDTLTSAPGVQTVRVRFLEGWRAEQYAEELVRAGILTDPQQFLQVLDAARWQPRFPFLADLLPNQTVEGFLFPDTYEFRVDATPEEIVETLLENFDRRVPAEMRARADQRGRPFYQVLIIASIVEREAAVPEERPVIASVFYNRLRENMPLQADPTVQYALGSAGNWWPSLDSVTDLAAVNSPYNTYRNAGLPPGPICNPGLAAIEAALSPADTDYLYFVTRGDGSGAHVFARTYEEHVRNIREQHGG
ncbi:MAG: endolytic transglycosylase MltG [Thermomicrobium sp.]|nr:endolytic transglycosylase MltG [Thermomicrobium sp.]MDW8059458.1 endolytic transglycosylase MltG [Thermomicrobium sp.]